MTNPPIKANAAVKGQIPALDLTGGVVPTADEEQENRFDAVKKLVQLLDFYKRGNVDKSDMLDLARSGSIGWGAKDEKSLREGPMAQGVGAREQRVSVQHVVVYFMFEWHGGMGQMSKEQFRQELDTLNKSIKAKHKSKLGDSQGIPSTGVPRPSSAAGIGRAESDGSHTGECSEGCIHQS